jgi:hypothetical protein
MRGKKIAATRRQKKDNQYWEKFRSILEAGQDCGEALALALAMPQQDIPARKFHTNLLSFLHDFTVPKGSNPEERSSYLALIRRLEASGEVKPGVRRQFEQALQANAAQMAVGQNG